MNSMLTEKSVALLRDGGFCFPTHGGSLAYAAKLTGTAVDGLIDFSANINLLGPPSAVQGLLKDSLPLVKAYPDPDCVELKKELSERLEVEPSWITVTNGASELIYLLPRFFAPGKEVLILNPSFSEYASAFRKAGVSIRNFHYRQEDGFQVDIQSLLAAMNQLKNLRGVVIGHPNNPTGALWDQDSFLTLLKVCERENIFLIVDESFIEFKNPGNSFLPYMGRSHHLIIVRSMTKFYSLPGLRIGYGIMPPDFARKIETFKPPWSVNALAQKCASAAIRDEAFATRSRAFFREETSRLLNELKKIEAIQTFPSDANFFLFRLREEDGDLPKRFYLDLLGDGILIRNCGNFDGLDPFYFRATALGKKENDEFIARLTHRLSSA